MLWQMHFTQKEQFMSIDNLMAKTNEILKENDLTSRHSYFQLKYFVINKEPTTQAKMWQCLRELKTRKDNIEHIQLEIEDSKDRKQLAELDLERINVKPLEEPIEQMKTLEFKSASINLRRKRREIAAVGKSIKELETRLTNLQEEADFFIKTFEKLNEIEDLKPFDDLECQKQYWNEKLTNELNMKRMLREPIGSELAKTIFSLNDDAPIKKELINIVEKIQLQEIENIKAQQKQVKGE
jgi:hypothetical protein